MFTGTLHPGFYFVSSVRKGAIGLKDSHQKEYAYPDVEPIIPKKDSYRRPFSLDFRALDYGNICNVYSILTRRMHRQSVLNFNFVKDLVGTKYNVFLPKELHKPLLFESDNLRRFILLMPINSNYKVTEWQNWMDFELWLGMLRYNPNQLKGDMEEC